MLFIFARKAMVTKKTTSSPFLTGAMWQRTNYGQTPPPIIPGLNITNTVIYNGNNYITTKNHILGNISNYKITGSAGNDITYRGVGGDVFIPGRGRDYIFGGAGHDIIHLSNSGNSHASGGAGNDVFILSGSAGMGGTIIEDYNPKEDRIDASQCGIGQLRSTMGTIGIVDLSGNSHVFLKNTGYKLTGNLKNDCFNLGIGYTTTPAPETKKETSALTALQLHQQFLVTKIHSGRSTNGNDVITGQGYIDGGEGDDKIIGSESNDLIYGGAGDDVIIPGRGRDYIFGGAGNDIIDLRNNAVSTADGGTGIDTFILGKGYGSATIQGYNPKEDRIDARECGIGDLRMHNGGIGVLAYGQKSSSIALLEDTGYQLTGNLKIDCQNLGITANQIGY